MRSLIALSIVVCAVSPVRADDAKPAPPEATRKIDLGAGYAVTFPSGDPKKLTRALPSGSTVEVWNVPATTGQGYQVSTFVVPERELARDGATETIESVFKGTLGSLERSGFKAEPVVTKDRSLDGTPGKEFEVQLKNADGKTLRFRTWILLDRGKIIQLAIFSTPADKYDEPAAQRFFDSLAGPKAK
jgi:hypothetical protein